MAEEANDPPSQTTARTDPENAGGVMRSKPFMAIAALAVMLFVGGGLWLFSGDDPEETRTASEEDLVPPEPSPLYFELPEILVNLGGDGETQRYLKLRAVIEYRDAALDARLNAVKPRLMDILHTYLRGLTAADIDGSAGMFRLKRTLTKRINVATAPHRIRDVLFQEMVVQ